MDRGRIWGGDDDTRTSTRLSNKERKWQNGKLLNSNIGPRILKLFFFVPFSGVDCAKLCLHWCNLVSLGLDYLTEFLKICIGKKMIFISNPIYLEHGREFRRARKKKLANVRNRFCLHSSRKQFFIFLPIPILPLQAPSRSHIRQKCAFFTSFFPMYTKI